MKRFILNLLSLYFGLLCGWLSTLSTNFWVSDRYFWLSLLNYLDNELSAFCLGIFVAFATLTKLLKTKSAHPLLLATLAIIIALTAFAFGYRFLYYLPNEIAVSPFFLLHLYFLTYVILFHFLTAFMPHQSSDHFLQKALLSILVPLTVLSILPIQSLLLKIAKPETKNQIARHFFGDIIDDDMKRIIECKEFEHSYGALNTLELNSSQPARFKNKRMEFNILDYNFSTEKARGSIQIYGREDSSSISVRSNYDPSNSNGTHSQDGFNLSTATTNQLVDLSCN